MKGLSPNDAQRRCSVGQEARDGDFGFEFSHAGSSMNPPLFFEQKGKNVLRWLRKLLTNLVWSDTPLPSDVSAPVDCDDDSLSLSERQFRGIELVVRFERSDA
jgi:hypothetical protein